MADCGDIRERSAPAVEPVDYIRLEAMIPMRDGVKLRTTVIIPKEATAAPIILNRTPYGLDDQMRSVSSARAADMLNPLPCALFEAGYAIATQHVRGKHGSEGVYEMNRPVRGPWNSSGIDHVTDAWDTIDWLVANVSQGNGKVAALGLSYDGFTALMQLLDPHPALAACVAISPMVDSWVGDDWFRNGIFHQQHALHYVNRQTRAKASTPSWPTPGHDEYDAWLAAGSAHAMAERLQLADLPAWQRLEQHPAYDGYWQAQSLEALLAERAAPVPTLHVHGQWDLDDAYGPVAAFLAMERSPGGGCNNHLVSGPWSHACAYFTDGEELGPLRFARRTARDFRGDLLLPFLEAFLKQGRGAAPIPKVATFAAGTESWRQFDAWPIAQDTRRFYLSSAASLREHTPDELDASDDYLSDPAKPVTHRPRPILRKDAPGFAWEQMGVIDQRFAGDRPDVLRYASAVLTEPVHLAGPPSVRLFASTSESDADWFVKLIDAYPDTVPDDEVMGGYQLAFASSGIRGRYVADRAHPTPLPSGQVVEYRITLPSITYTLRPGHRLMLQIQSSMFPAFDRNPQRFVPNIFFAEAGDYVKATHRVYRQVGAASVIELPVLP